MSARKLSDKEFDRYARNLLKKPEGVAFDNAAWSAMEKQLGQAGPKPFIEKLKWLISLGIIVLVSVGYLGYQSLTSSAVEQEVVEDQSLMSDGDPNTSEYATDLDSKNQSSEELVSEDEESENHISESENYEEDSEDEDSKEKALLAGLNPSQTDEAEPKNVIISEAQSFDSPRADQPVSKTTLAKVNQESEASTDREELTQPTQDELSDKNEELGLVREASIVQDENDLDKRATEQTSTEETSRTNEEVPSIVQESVGQGIVAEEDEKENELLEVESIKNEIFVAQVEKQHLILLPEKEEILADSSTEDQEDVQPFSRWGVGLTVAPDFSTVGELNEFTRPGLDIGVTVEYFIFRRLSVTTGAILTRKLYNTTDLSEYTFPAGLWNGGEAPQEVLANCKVIDIPINLRYRVIEGKRTSLFASAGISSYLMLNERYDYSYATGQYSNQPRGWEVSNENNHFFGVYNLSAGISRRIGRNVNVEAEPFLKNSLGGVGWGQVRLKSTGMLFHIKYNF